MTFPRFYCPGEITAGRSIELPASAAHHAARVLRLEQGDQITLFNGNGGEFSAIIARIDKSGVMVAVEKQFDIERESPLNITLVQAVCASEKMDWIMQKAVELGVSRIQPIATRRSVVKLAGERADKRARHWQQIVASACEQCGRNHLPQVLPLLSLPDWLGEQMTVRKNPHAGVPGNLYFMLAPTAEKGLRDFPEATTAATLTLLVGPEGGLAPEEEAAARATGFVSLRLGGRILRTETAALAAVAALQTLWGDF
ncbi:MAG: 16S rRNA (uracil(1498)-N(3))-methyltransferase [Nitrosospira sp.]|nr:16S rRNA (uracil(1498)-N(3))-methyltransferase [Nitrosospira sp.]